MARGVFVSRKEAENTTLSYALDRYGREISSQKKGGPIEFVRIRRWQNSKFGPRNRASLSGKDMAAWRDEDFSALKLRPNFTVRDFKIQWLGVLDRAKNLIQALPPEQAGCLYLNAHGNPVNPDLNHMDEVTPHYESLGGDPSRRFTPPIFPLISTWDKNGKPPP